MLRPLAFVFVLPLSSVACSATSPTGSPSPFWPDAGFEGPPPTSGAGDKPALSIEPPDTSTPYDSIPIRGTGPAGGTVFADRGGEHEVQTIDADGRFCIDVPLAPDQENTIRLKASDEQGVFSDAVDVIVEQGGDPPGEGGEAPLKNVTQGGKVTVHFFGHDSGLLENIVDGDANTTVRLDEQISYNGWVIIELTESAAIHSVRVRTRADCAATRYQAYVIHSESEPPVPPDQWTEILDVDEASLSADEELDDPMEIAGPVKDFVATHLAISLDGGCYITPLTPDFVVLEIEAFAPAEEASTPPPEAPACELSGDLP